MLCRCALRRRELRSFSRGVRRMERGGTPAVSPRSDRRSSATLAVSQDGYGDLLASALGDMDDAVLGVRASAFGLI